MGREIGIADTQRASLPASRTGCREAELPQSPRVCDDRCPSRCVEYFQFERPKFRIPETKALPVPEKLREVDKPQ